MRKSIIFGLVFLILIVSVSGIEVKTLPEITIVYDTGEIDNVAIGDNNIVDLYCNSEGSICNVYRTNSRHTTLSGD